MIIAIGTQNKFAILPKAENIEIEITGHTRIIRDKRTFEVLKKYI